MKKLACAVLATILLSACGSGSSDAPNPQVGETWYVQDHAYTDEVYHLIENGAGKGAPPAQTTDNQPDRSFHFTKPYKCKIEEIADDGFYRCKTDSDHEIEDEDVWTDHLISEDDYQKNHRPDPPATGIPKYLIVKKGQLAYIGTDGGDATTATICASSDDYKKFSGMSNDQGDCKKHEAGTLVRIIQSVDDYSHDPSGKLNVPVVQIQSTDGRILGWISTMVSLFPVIPKHTILYARKVGDSSPKLQSISNAPNNDGVDLSPGTPVELLLQDESTQGNDFKVKVKTGPYTGRTGWLDNMDVNAQGNNSIMFYAVN